MNTEEKEIQNVTSDSEDQGTSTPVPSSKKKRNIPAIVASVIAFLAIVSSISNLHQIHTRHSRKNIIN